MYRFLILIFIVLWQSNLSAQSHLKFGEWKSYLPYKFKMKALVETKNKIFCSAGHSLLSVDKEDLSLDFYDKVNAINDVDIADIEYDKFNNQLVIVYGNGGIDIMSDEEIMYVSDIRDNVSLLGKKNINDINIADENFIYLSFDYGLTQLNSQNLEFGFTCFTGFRVTGSVQIEDKLYMSTDNGLYSLDLKSGKNPNDIGSWQRLYGNQVNYISVFDNKVFYESDNKIAFVDADNSSKIVLDSIEANYKVIFTNSSQSNLIVGAFYEDKNRNLLYLIDEELNIAKKEPCVKVMKDMIIDDNGRCWYTTDWEPGIKYSDDIDSNCKKLFVNSPFQMGSSDIKSFGDKIFVASGGANKLNYSYSNTAGGISVYSGGEWKIYNQWRYDYIRDNDISNMLAVLPSQKENKVYVGSYWAGLLEIDLDNDEFQLWDQYNTGDNGLRHIEGDEQRTRIADMQFDSEDNVWISNFGSVKPLVVYTPQKEWYSFKMNNNHTQIAEMTIDGYDQLWLKSYTNGVIVYNTNGTIKNPTDDKMINLTIYNSNLPSNNVTDVKADLDGNVWVGTDEGIVVFECPGSAIEGDCKGSVPKTVLEGIPAIVLDNANITVIEVDGANRKWIGSSSGLYVLSPEGDEELMHFTADNSPLFNDYITSLGYNPNTGEMIIGTLSGILSYKTETLHGKLKNSSYAYAFPNPVAPDYEGLIAIKGLARDANVKITDISGRLVYETKALGGQAIWSGRDLQGRKVNSGVYTVFSTGTNDFEEPEAISLKIFFVN